MRRRIIIYASLFILAVTTGITVGCLGQPYESTAFALHKIISVGAIVLTVIIIRKQIKETGVTPAVRASVIVLTVSAMALLTTGALMSLGLADNIIRAVHAASPLPAAAAIVLANVSFGGKRRRKTYSREIE